MTPQHSRTLTTMAPTSIINKGSMKRHSHNRNSHDYSSKRNSSSSSSLSSSCCSSRAEETIALFGAHSSTGRHFVKLALDAGYIVQTLVPTASVMDMQHPSLTILEGSLEDVEKLQQVLHNATFVVSMLGETLSCKKASEYKQNILLDFTKTLYPLMKESCTRLFLYQANSLTIDASGKAPIVSRLLKETSNVLGRNAHNKDNDEVVKFIVQHENEYFDYVVTRPGLLREGPSKKKLQASRSLPGPVPMTYMDLAEFSLQALMEKKLYNTCPYVVGDGF